jgi:hypothetical protein
MNTEQTKRPPHRPRKEPVVRGPEPEYLTIDEFCAMTAVSRKSWPRHRQFLSTIKIGVRTLIRRSEARRYLSSLERPAEKATGPRV